MNRELLKNIPKDSPLYTYLITKEETSRIRTTISNVHFANLPHWVEDPKVLLVNPPMCIPGGMPKRCLPPAALAHIAAVLREMDIKVELLDCIVEGWETEVLIDEKNDIYAYGMSEEAFAEYLLDSKPDIIGMSLVFSQDLKNMCKLTKMAKQVLPECTIIAGGLHPTIYPESTFKHADGSIDYILRGEGEYRLAEFVCNYREGKVDMFQDGMVGYFYDDYEKLVTNPEIDKIQDLDALPLPAYDLLPMEEYFRINMPCNCFPNGDRIMAVHTSRGCPIGCTFCSSTNFNYLFRARSPQSVFEEIRHYKNTYGVDEIQFLDDNLLLNTDRAEEIFDLITPLGISWCTPNGTMINTWKPHLIDKAVKSGMYQVTLALDGLNEISHSISRKPVNLKSLADKIDVFRSKGVLVHGFVVVGLPGEKKEDILTGLDWVKTLNFTSVSIYIAQPYPGSELYEVELAKGTIREEDGLLVAKTRSFIHNTELDSEFLEEAIRNFTLEYEQIIKAREGESWNFRYERKLKRLANKDLHLIIGTGDRINMLIQADRMASE